jgi:hypothetical protein
MCQPSAEAKVSEFVRFLGRGLSVFPRRSQGTFRVRRFFLRGLFGGAIGLRRWLNATLQKRMLA